MKYRIIFALSALLLWACLSWLEIWPKYIFPSPIMVFESLYKGFCTDGHILLMSLLISVRRGLIGFLVTIAIGLFMGIIMSISNFFEETLKMVSLGVQSIPSICWVPLSILWFGLNEGAIIFVMIMGSCFSISISTYSGIKHVSPIYINVAKNLGASGIKLLQHVIIPCIMPSLVVGIKQGWAFIWRALMAGEILSSNVGLGRSLVMARDLADISGIFSIMIIISSVGYVIEKLLFEKIEYRVKMKRGLLNFG